MTDDPNDPERIVRETLTAWASRDLERTLRFVAPDIDFHVNVDPAVAPFATSAKGIDAVRARLQLMLDTFHFDAFVPGKLHISADQPGIVRLSVTYFYREKSTNARIDGHFRLVFEVRDNLIVCIEELHDSPYIESFARLVRMMGGPDSSAQ